MWRWAAGNTTARIKHCTMHAECTARCPSACLTLPLLGLSQALCVVGNAGCTHTHVRVVCGLADNPYWRDLVVGELTAWQVVPLTPASVVACNSLSRSTRYGASENDGDQTSYRIENTDLVCGPARRLNVIERLGPPTAKETTDVQCETMDVQRTRFDDYWLIRKEGWLLLLAIF